MKTIGLIVMLLSDAIGSCSGLTGGAAGKPLMGFMPGAAVVLLPLVQDVVFVGAYEKIGVLLVGSFVGGTETVEVIVGVIVMVVWRLMSPAAAGPARRAEMKILASILGC